MLVVVDDHRKPIGDRTPIAALEAGQARKARRKATGLRKPAPIELRPASVQHSYRYSSTDESPHSKRGSPRHVVAGRTSGG